MKKLLNFLLLLDLVLGLLYISINFVHNPEDGKTYRLGVNATKTQQSDGSTRLCHEIENNKTHCDTISTGKYNPLLVFAVIVFGLWEFDNRIKELGTRGALKLAFFATVIVVTGMVLQKAFGLIGLTALLLLLAIGVIVQIAQRNTVHAKSQS